MTGVSRACAGIGAALLGLALPSLAGAATYACSNKEFEIRCNADACGRSADHTPMVVEINTRSRRLDVCAYSACWSGRASVLLVGGNGVIARGDRLAPDTPRAGRADVAVVIDRAGSSASLSAFGFQNPMSCSLR